MILDIAFGVSLAAIIAHFFGFEPSLLWYVLGIAFALLPDVDVFVSYGIGLVKKRWIGKGKFAHEHRDLLHYPIFFVGVGILLFFVCDVPTALLFATAVFAHFAHDTVHIGWGIAWLWPFSERTYKCFSDEKGRWSRNFIQSWSKADLHNAASLYGSDTWLRETYFSFSPTLIFESVALCASLVLAFCLAA